MARASWGLILMRSWKLILLVLGGWRAAPEWSFFQSVELSCAICSGLSHLTYRQDMLWSALSLSLPIFIPFNKVLMFSDVSPILFLPLWQYLWQCFMSLGYLSTPPTWSSAGLPRAVMGASHLRCNQSEVYCLQRI